MYRHFIGMKNPMSDFMSARESNYLGWKPPGDQYSSCPPLNCSSDFEPTPAISKWSESLFHPITHTEDASCNFRFKHVNKFWNIP